MDHSEIFDAVKDLNLFSDEYKLHVLSDKVWDVACCRSSGKLSKKHLYLCISQNRCGILDKLKVLCNVDTT